VGVGAKNPKPSCPGSVLGLPCQTAMVGGGGVAHTRRRQPWGGLFANMRWGVGLGARKPEIKLLWLGFGSAAP
jgi:hypothetical protein